jgi:erythromycin esterase
MLEFLVREMGFTVFAIEASYPACFNINEYVLTGKGDRAKALASQGFWTWDTNEVSDMIDWMRAYNEKAPAGKKVKFLGYDLQHFGQGLDLVIAYLKKVAPEYVETAEAMYKPLRLSVQDYTKRSEEEINQTRSQMRDLIGFLAYNQARFVRQTSAAEFDLAMQHARIPLQFDDSYTRSVKDPKFIYTRDYYMAENIESLMKTEGPGTKMVVWAHNGHIQTGVLGAQPSMGAYLRKFFGDAYYALGFSFNEGGFQSRDLSQKGRGALTEFTFGPASAGTGDWYFAQSGITNYVVDFRGAPKEGKVAHWLSSTLLMRSVGSGFATDRPERNFLSPTVLKNQYDGMIFIARTTRARPNPSGMRGPMSE